MSRSWRTTYNKNQHRDRLKEQEEKQKILQPRNPETTHIRRNQDIPEEFKKGIHGLMFKVGTTGWTKTTVEEETLLTLDEYRILRTRGRCR